MVRVMRRVWVWGLCLLLTTGESIAQPPVVARPWPEMDALFQKRHGWIGGDGAYSVVLPDGKALWLFSDTWIGDVTEGRRRGTIVNNTVAIQEGRGAAAKIAFHVRRDAADQPRAMIAPADGKGWFWLFAAAAEGDRLHLFLPQFDKTAGGGAFGFRQIGLWLGEVANPTAAPSDWKIEQRRAPFCELTEKRQLTFGGAIARHEDYIYVYGADDHRTAMGLKRQLVLARVPVGSLADFPRWRFFGGGEWKEDFRAVTHLADNLAAEFSVTYHAKRRRFVCVYTAGGLSKNILARAADNPWGPWSEPTKIFECPEMAWDRRIFCYAAKAHPHLGDDDELVVSYATNSHELSHVASDTRLYWPRFVRVPWSVVETKPAPAEQPRPAP